MPIDTNKLINADGDITRFAMQFDTANPLHQIELTINGETGESFANKLPNPHSNGDENTSVKFLLELDKAQLLSSFTPQLAGATMRYTLVTLRASEARLTLVDAGEEAAAAASDDEVASLKSQLRSAKTALRKAETELESTIAERDASLKQVVDRDRVIAEMEKQLDAATAPPSDAPPANPSMPGESV